jgi:hypothetical protein
MSEDVQQDPVEIETEEVETEEIDIKQEATKDEPQCWICYNEMSGGELIRCCKCKGSIEYVHEECLLKWIDVGKKECCDRCSHKYDIDSEYSVKWHKYINTRFFDIALSIAVVGIIYYVIHLVLSYAVFNRYGYYNRVNIYYSFFKFETVICLIFLIFLLIYKCIGNDSNNTYLNIFHTKFNDHYTTFLNNLQDNQGYNLHEVGHGVNMFSLIYIIYMTLTDFFSESKRVFIKLKRKVKAI